MKIMEREAYGQSMKQTNEYLQRTLFRGNSKNWPVQAMHVGEADMHCLNR
jgi:hypothetical protein